jgi:hypothetical protein
VRANRRIWVEEAILKKQIGMNRVPIELCAASGNSPIGHSDSEPGQRGIAFSLREGANGKGMESHE